jgi:hypothetical protein
MWNEEVGIKNKDRIMAILDEIKDLSSDRTTEYLVYALQKRVGWAYEYAEKCDLHGVIATVGYYDWLGGLYKGLTKKESGVSDVLGKIEDKIRYAEYLLVSDLVEMLKTKCGCRSI